MANWEKLTCKVNGINIHYTRTGGNKPVLILLHGLMANGACWTNVAKLLEKDYDIIIPDARGHGESSKPDSGYQYENLANDVIGLIHLLKLSSPILLGHSMGGMTAAVVANRCPSLLRGLILADPTFISLEFQQEVFDSDVRSQHEQILKTPLEELVAEMQRTRPDRSLNTIEFIARARYQTSLAAFEVLTPPNPDYQQLVKPIGVPSLLIYGDKGVVTTAVAEELKSLNPKLHAEMIPGVGHGLHYDQPDRFATVVKAFIRSKLSLSC